MLNRIPIIIKNRCGDTTYSIYGFDTRTGYVIGNYLHDNKFGEIKEKRMEDLDVDMELMRIT